MHTGGEGECTGQYCTKLDGVLYAIRGWFYFLFNASPRAKETNYCCYKNQIKIKK